MSEVLTLCDEFRYLWNSFAFASENTNVSPEFADLILMLVRLVVNERLGKGYIMAILFCSILCRQLVNQ